MDSLEALVMFLFIYTSFAFGLALVKIFEYAKTKLFDIKQRKVRAAREEEENERARQKLIFFRLQRETGDLNV